VNPALTYLATAHLKRNTLHFFHQLRRPTRLIGVAAIVFFLACLFHYRHADIFAALARPASLLGGGLLMAGGALFKGFLQRGLTFEPPDIDFLFTRPFTQRQIVLYRLAPSYLFSLGQAAVFTTLFWPHLKHPAVALVCLTLFQIACFHLAMAASIFAGTLADQLHHRLRWMLLSVYFMITAIYLREAWDLNIVPAFVKSPAIQMFFYPAVTLGDLRIPNFARLWAWRLAGGSAWSTEELGRSALYVAGFAAAAAASLWLLLGLRGSVFEPSLAITARAADARLRRRQGRHITTVETGRTRSARLPKLAIFQGVGAVIWKNLVVARRSRRELALAAAFTLIFTAFLLALRHVFHGFLTSGGQLPEREVRDFDAGLAATLAMLAFFMQWTLRFDFRRDGPHLLAFRALPVSPLALAVAEISTPTLLCLLFQGIGIAGLMCYASLPWIQFLALPFGFLAIAVALNGVWNLHYLMAAVRSAGGKPQPPSAVGMLMVVGLSFLVFFPAGWTAMAIGQRYREWLGIASWYVVQYAVDFGILLALGRLLQHFEVSRDA